MARLPRLYVSGCSHHIIQRGNNGDACFFDEKDCAFYLQQLKISAGQSGVAIHALRDQGGRLLDPKVIR